ncbi:hypothetical protein [Hymenobacter cellulosilyticus]|uniref:Uncharacterized protein n=1 Tax=Hymenobacter cellulosilyticus TaxID=2932248 RepID=A0A8T9Q446_9BACT|nr:hypothetical protein [Hymenobacter cellulosilyticus]UOQ71201.1 hypothetical protein MUN79_21490 [Hymenobacter cellulosilyticus]
MALPRELRNPAFWLPLGLYLLYYANSHFLHWPVPPLIASYFSDLLAMPVILTLALAVQRRWVQRTPAFTLPDSWLLGPCFTCRSGLSWSCPGCRAAFSATRSMWRPMPSARCFSGSC